MAKTLNVAMIGGGFMGKAHAWPMRRCRCSSGRPRQFHREGGCRCDRRPGGDGALALWLRRSLDRLEGGRARDDIDIVDIVTPNDTHAEIAIAAARAGSTSFARSRSPAPPEARTMLDAVKGGHHPHGRFQLSPHPRGRAGPEAHRRGPHRQYPLFPRHLPAGLVGRSGLPAVLAVPEERRRLGRGRRHRHPRHRLRALSGRRNRRRQRHGQDLCPTRPMQSGGVDKLAASDKTAMAAWQGRCRRRDADAGQIRQWCGVRSKPRATLMAATTS